MKVAVVGDAASINVQRWCEGLVEADAEIDVEVVSFAHAWRPDIRVHRLPLGSMGKARYVLLGPLVRWVVARIDPDVVVGYFVPGYGTLARAARRRPLVQITAGDDVLITPPGSFAHRQAARNLRAADLVIAWAPHMADAVTGFGVPRDRILVQPRGIPLDGYPLSARADRSMARVVCTRSLRPEYRHDVLLRAMADPRCADLFLTIVGDGPERNRLEALARELAIDGRVAFVGQVSNSQLASLLSGHDCYVSACDRDGVSASLLEAMAAGLVPVVSVHPANRWWIDDGVNGLLVQLSPASVAAALERATTDDALRARAAAQNPAIVRERGDLATNMQVFVGALSALRQVEQPP